MAKKIVQTKTHDFDQMLLNQARQAVHPAAIAPLIRMAKQAGAKGTAKALQRIEKSLAKQVEAAEKKALKAKTRARKRKAKSVYVGPDVDLATVSTSCTNRSTISGDGEVYAWGDGKPIGGHSIQH